MGFENFSKEPEGGKKENAGKIKILFPDFVYRPDMKEWDIGKDLETKYVERLLMKGGPFIQPEEFFAHIPPDNLIGEMRKEFGGFDDSSLDKQFINKDYALSSSEIADKILKREKKLPLVFKPNKSALGGGIFFLDESENGNLTVSMKNFEGGSDKDPENGAIKYLSGLREIGITLDLKEDGNVIFVDIPEGRREEVLEGLLKYCSVKKFPHYDDYDKREVSGEFDPGMFESVINSWKYKGRSYETRHFAVGNFGTDKLDKIMDSHARIGSSALFSNQWMAYNPTGSRIKAAEMYDPLLETFIPDERMRKEFLSEFREKLAAGFHHLSNQLTDNGFILDKDNIEVQFDFLWVPPAEEGGFPQPAMTEYELHYPFLSGDDLKYRK